MIVREFKKLVVKNGKTINESWVEYECKNCKKLKQMNRSDYNRRWNTGYCSLVCARKHDNPNGNWWEDAYNAQFSENSGGMRGGSSIGSARGKYKTRDLRNSDGQYDKYDIAINKALRTPIC